MHCLLSTFASVQIHGHGGMQHLDGCYFLYKCRRKVYSWKCESVMIEEKIDRDIMLLSHSRPLIAKLGPGASKVQDPMCITMCSFSLFPENVWQKCLQIHLKSLYPILMVIAQGDSFGRFWNRGSGKSLWVFRAGNCSSWLLVQVPRPMSGYLKTVKDFWNRQGNFWNLSFHAH